MIGMVAVILAVVNSLYKEFLAVSFDEEFSQVCGINVRRIYLVLLCLVALTVVLLVRIVGIVLVIALLTIPATIAKMFTNSLKRMMALSVVIALVLSVSGLWLSYVLDMASGATIIVLSGLSFMAASVFRYYLKR
jgi:zinc transport system permease protein